MSHALKAGALYFAIVFSVGFVLGPVRELWAAPRFGRRAAELMEAPLMLAAIWLAARWTARRLGSRATVRPHLQTGAVALGILLIAEFTVVLWVRGLTLGEYIAGRDPVAGTVYLLLLVIFALAPALARRKSR